MVRRAVFIQPVVPHYRVPLFDALARTGEFELRVLASPRFPGAPPSVESPPAWADTRHPCLGVLGDALLWQRGLALPDDFGIADVLVINGNPRILSNVPLVSRARRTGAGVVWWGHAWSPTSVTWRFRLRLEMMRVADVVLLYDEREVAILRATRSWDRPLVAANNAIDQSAIRHARSLWNAARLDEFARSHQIVDTRLMLFCGRLRQRPGTGLDVALRALRQLVDLDSRYQLAVIGTGEDEARLRRLAAELGIADHVRWLGAVYDEAAIAPWFMTARCFVYPGSIGLSLLHAFGYGLPVVTHEDRRLHNPEIGALEHEQNGLLFRRDDALSLAGELHRLCEDDSLRARLSHVAHETVTVRYTLESMVQRMCSAIAQAAERARHGRAPHRTVEMGRSGTRR